MYKHTHILCCLRRISNALVAYFKCPRREADLNSMSFPLLLSALLGAGLASASTAACGVNTWNPTWASSADAACARWAGVSQQAPHSWRLLLFSCCAADAPGRPLWPCGQPRSWKGLASHTQVGGRKLGRPEVWDAQGGLPDHVVWAVVLRRHMLRVLHAPGAASTQPPSRCAHGPSPDAVRGSAARIPG